MEDTDDLYQEEEFRPSIEQLFAIVKQIEEEMIMIKTSKDFDDPLWKDMHKDRLNKLAQARYSILLMLSDLSLK